MLSRVHYTPKDCLFFIFRCRQNCLITGVVDTGKKMYQWLTPVSNNTALAINFRFFCYLWPVSTTLGKNVIASVNDTGGKFFTGVNNTTGKFFIGNKLYWLSRSVLSAKLWTAFQEHGLRCKKTAMCLEPSECQLVQTKTAITPVAIFGQGRQVHSLPLITDQSPLRPP